MGMATGFATASSPILVGTIATVVGGPNGWRWSFDILSVPALVVAVIAFRLKEARRGQHEKLDVLGEVIDDTKPVPPSLEAAWTRIMKIRTHAVWSSSALRPWVSLSSQRPYLAIYS